MVTIDTNIAIYALTDNEKFDAADRALMECTFLSVQVLNEYVNATFRKKQRTLREAAIDVADLVDAVDWVASLEIDHHRDAIRIADRYNLTFYDSLMIAVALANGATTLFSEDMHHGLVIDGKLKITNPFLPMDSQ